jgi:O-antigen/teichoic acid export membrane protein
VLIRGRLLARNTLINLVGQGLPLIVAVLTMPIVIRGLGAERFGILSLIWVVLGYFSVFDLGFGRAATKLVGEALGRGHSERVPRIVWTAVLCQLVLGLLGFVVLAITTPVLVERVLKTPPHLLNEARNSFLILALCIPGVLAAGSFRGLLEANQRFDLVNYVRAPFIVATFAIPLAGVLVGWSLPVIVLVLVAAQAATAAAYCHLSLRTFPSLRTVPRLDREELRRLAWFGGWVTVSSVVSPLLVYMERFIIGIRLSVAAVAYYSAPHEVASRLLIIPISLVGTLFPAFTTLAGQGDLQRVDALTARAIKYLMLSLGPVVILVTVNARDILTLWLGSDFAQHSTRVLQLVAIGVLINAMALVPFSLLQARGRPDLTAKFHLVELPLQIVLVLVCMRSWGITGAAIAWSVRVTVDATLLFIAAYRLRAWSPTAFLVSKVPQTALVLLTGAALAGAISTVVTAPWTRAVLTAAVFLAAAAVAWRTVFDAAERSQIGRLLHAERPGG